MSTPPGSEPVDARPALRVVRGEPTPEDVAAIVVALATKASARPAPAVRSRWADRAALLRTPHSGPWRAGT